MRQSTRLKDSDIISKLKDEGLLVTTVDEEEEYAEVGEVENGEEEFDLEEKLPVNSKKPKKRGRPRKTAPKPIELENKPKNEFIDDNYEELNASESASPKSPKKNASKKKIRRTGGYVPPLETFPGLDGNLLSPRAEWKLFFEEENSKIKRRNRHYNTIMLSQNETIAVERVKNSSFSNFDESRKLVKKPLKISFGNDSINLFDNYFVKEGKIACYNVGTLIFSISFCNCLDCKAATGTILIYAASAEVITILSAKLSKKEGIISLKEIGQVLRPESESFKSICVVGSILSIASDSSLYFLNCDLLHREGTRIILEKGPKIITESSNLISCHSWRGKHIVVGTISGRVHVFNSSLKEIFQISVKSDSAIYSLDWRDNFTILIGGNFSNIFSIDLRDPFVIEVEVSALGKTTTQFIFFLNSFIATLPKVIWSQSLNSILFSDAENHVRRLEKSKDTVSRFHHPIGTFDSMVNDMKTSPNHCITATACASGSIHLAWMSDEIGSSVEYEKRIFSLNMTDNGTFESILDPEYVPFQIHDTIKLYPSLQSCTTVDWCPNESFPGLLVGGYRNGLIVLITTDRFFI